MLYWWLQQQVSFWGECCDCVLLHSSKFECQSLNIQIHWSSGICNTLNVAEQRCCSDAGKCIRSWGRKEDEIKETWFYLSSLRWHEIYYIYLLTWLNFIALDKFRGSSLVHIPVGGFSLVSACIKSTVPTVLFSPRRKQLQILDVLQGRPWDWAQHFLWSTEYKWSVQVIKITFL